MKIKKFIFGLHKREVVMKRLFLALLVLTVTFCFLSCGKREGEKLEEKVMFKEEAQEPRYVEGEVLVKFKPEIGLEEIEKIIKEEYRCEILDVIKGLEVYRLKIPKDKTVPEMVELLSKDQRVKYAEPNLIYRLQE